VPGLTKNRHCSFCGHAFDAAAPWPRRCASCGETSWVNPTPVAVILVPVDGGLLTVRRKIPPQAGALALPGGYVNLGETWQQAGAREVYEETGVAVDPEGIVDFRAISGESTVLVFGVARPLTGVPRLTAPNDEVSELVILRDPEPLAFPSHTRAVEQYFARW
jgi:ADP-ribose pyrophosphatase YjhB (NUDIX family)